HGAKLDSLLVLRALNNAIDVNPGRVNLVWIELAYLDQLLDFSDADIPAGRDHRIEVSRGHSINEIARLIAFPCLHDGELGPNAGLQHVFLVAKLFRFFGFREFRSEACSRVKAGNARAAS